MVRLFQVYYPVRTLMLFGGELLIVALSFVLATMSRLGPDAYIALSYESGLTKILGISVGAIIASHYVGLYAPERMNSSGETFFRILMVLATLSFFLGGVSYFFPDFSIGQDVFLLGLVILTFAMLLWRAVYPWLLRRPWLQEQVYVLGSGPRADIITHAIRTRYDLGMRLANIPPSQSENREDLAFCLSEVVKQRQVKRVIVALAERREKMPTRELLDLRLSGVKVDDTTDLIEQITGRVEIDGLQPSAMIFAKGFNVSAAFIAARRCLSITVSLVLLLLLLPILPLIALAIRLTSPGPVFFRQQRVGRHGKDFTIYKFRTMRQNGAAQTAAWAAQDDPRITSIGRFLRKTRLDEVPQLWNVLKGDMGFVGPRPEQPEFVQWLQEAIPYYGMRHIIRPGLTGWAQVRYEYGASMEQTKEKLRYDLYYIKHMSLSFDLWILFETVRTVLFGRGAR